MSFRLYHGRQWRKSVLTYVILVSAEKAVNERLAHTPELYLLALAQFAISADTEVVSLEFLLSFGGTAGGLGARSSSDVT